MGWDQGSFEDPPTDVAAVAVGMTANYIRAQLLERMLRSIKPTHIDKIAVALLEY